MYCVLNAPEQSLEQRIQIIYIYKGVLMLGFPRSLASTEQQRKESRTPKALMLRNKHMNAIFLCLGVS